MNTEAQGTHSGARGNTKGTRARRWCFTLNNYTKEEHEHAQKKFEKALYFICGEEVGKSGTPHLQGYLETKNPTDIKTLKNILPRAHWEKAKGTREHNTGYCSKDGKAIEFENKPEKKKKNKIFIPSDEWLKEEAIKAEERFIRSRYCIEGSDEETEKINQGIIKSLSSFSSSYANVVKDEIDKKCVASYLDMDW